MNDVNRLDAFSLPAAVLQLARGRPAHALGRHRSVGRPRGSLSGARQPPAGAAIVSPRSAGRRSAGGRSSPSDASLTFPATRAQFGRFGRTSPARQSSPPDPLHRSHMNDVNPQQPRHVHKPPAHEAAYPEFGITAQRGKRTSAVAPTRSALSDPATSPRSAQGRCSRRNDHSPAGELARAADQSRGSGLRVPGVPQFVGIRTGPGERFPCKSRGEGTARLESL